MEVENSPFYKVLRSYALDSSTTIREVKTLSPLEIWLLESYKALLNEKNVNEFVKNNLGKYETKDLIKLQKTKSAFDCLFDVNISEATRRRPTTIARQVFCWWAMKNKYNPLLVGELVNRDRTTVLAAYKRTNMQLEVKDSYLLETIDRALPIIKIKETI